MSTATTRTNPSTAGAAAPADPAPDDDIPPLQNGDCLTRAEFERRYEAMPALKKAELIDGIVYIPSPDSHTHFWTSADMPSPVSHRRHGRPHFRLIGWLNVYCASTPGTEGGDNSSVRIDLDNEPQPDACLLIQPECGGQARINPGDEFLDSAPELAAEVAASSASYDLHKKLETYRRSGVREYVVWRVRNRQIDWFVNREGRFERLAPGDDGLYRSEVFPGLWLDPAALMTGDMTRVFAIVGQGTASPEHAAFVERLKEAAARLAPPAGPAPPPEAPSLERPR